MIFASSGSKYFWFYYYGSSGIRIYANNGSGQQGITGISSDLNQHTMEFKNKTYYIDGVSKGSLSNSYTETTNNMWLFSYGNNNYPFKGRIYYVEIIKNKIKQRVFIPAKRLTDSAIGMYDLITENFYTSSNTAFTAGATIGTLTIQDSSGYGHNGSLLNAPTTIADNARYSSSINFNGTTDGILIENLNISNIINTAVTYSFWIKPNGENGARSVYFGSYSGTSWSIEKTTGNVLRLYWNGSPDETCSGATVTDGIWQHICITKNGTNDIKVYINGTQKWASTATHNNLTFPTTFRIGKDTRSNDGTPYKGQISDFRIYCTPLLDTDIKLLYNSSMRIDNLGSTHCFATDESATNQLTKTGILKNNIIEPYLTLPDGSKWKLMLYHYVDGGNNLFTQSNATYCNNFGLFSRLKDIANYIYDGKYEYYVVQDGKEFRWTQTSSPTASSIAGLTTVSGYTNPVNGLAKANQSYTYIGYGAWWGAVGCWTSYSTGGKTGIPGFGSHDANGICTTYLALYTRVPNTPASFSNETSYATNFIEL